jgi:hypothetical protein
MQHFALRFLAAMTMSIAMASSYGLTPGTQTFSRRHALDRLVGFGSVSLVVLVAPSALAAEKAENKPETTEEKKSRELKAKERFTTVDYSCVAATGSPCKEPKSVFPSDGKIEDL